MKLFELFATLGLDTEAFDRGAAQAAARARQLAQSLGRTLAAPAKIGMPELPDGEAAKTRLADWWSGVWGQGLFDTTFAFHTPSTAAAVASINAWWERVRGAASLSLGAAFLGMATAAQSAAAPGRYATGLSYVPYDEYPALLHQGEAVLTRMEAESWRTGGQADLNRIGGRVEQAVREGIAGVRLYLDGRAVGEAVTETVSRGIARRAREGRYVP